MYHILFNPLAGNRQGQTKAQELRAVLEPLPTVFEDVRTISDMKGYLALLPAEDSIVLAGGDGTINHFINQLNGQAPKQHVYYYPCGSGNDFAKDTEHAPRSENSLLLLNPYLKNLPTVTVNGQTSYFLNGIGFGIDGYCCEVGDKQKETSDKPINYTSIAIEGLLFHFKPCAAKVTVDGVEHHYRKVWLAPTMKGRFYGGGMMVAPHQNRMDPEGKCSVAMLYGSGKIKTLLVFPSIFKGEHIHHTEMTEILTGHDITVEFEKPCALQIDGETILNVTTYSVHAPKVEDT